MGTTCTNCKIQQVQYELIREDISLLQQTSPRTVHVDPRYQKKIPSLKEITFELFNKQDNDIERLEYELFSSSYTSSFSENDSPFQNKQIPSSKQTFTMINETFDKHENRTKEKEIKKWEKSPRTESQEKIINPICKTKSILKVTNSRFASKMESNSYSSQQSISLPQKRVGFQSD